MAPDFNFQNQGESHHRLPARRRTPAVFHPIRLEKMFSQSDRAFQRRAGCARVGDISAGRARALLTSWLRDQMVRHAVRGRDGVRRAECPLGGGGNRPQTSRPSHPRDTTLQKLTYRKLLVGRTCWRMLAWHSYGWRAGWPVVAQRQRHTGGHSRVVEAGQSARPAELLSGTPTMLACAELAGLKHIVTSRAFLERTRLNADDF